MTTRRRGVRGRLLISHVAVALVGIVTMFVVSAVVARAVYERRLGGFGFGRTEGRGQGQGQAATTIDGVSQGRLVALLDDALLPALIAGTAAALAATGLVAWWLGRRLLEPLEQLRVATRRMAAGEYDTELPRPDTEELAALASDVGALADHLAHTERRRNQLLAEVTHELRTPLTIVTGTTEGLIDGVIEPSPEVFGALADQTARLERIVGDLTLLSRSDEGTIPLEPEDGDLATIASTAAERLRPQFDHAGVELVVEHVPPCPVRADVQRLSQIVTNLMGNALGHTPAGGRVTVSVGRDRDRAVVDVTDTGTGIAPDELDRIFERFYRGGSAPAVGRPTPAGRGIGLTIARSLARAHGGDVTASSDGIGHGATFRCWLPAADA